MEEIELPSWLDESFLTTALQGDETLQPPVKVVNFFAERAVAKGNNYTSLLFRVKCEYTDGVEQERKTISLIVKAPITKGWGSDLDDMGIYSREPKMYSEVLPVMGKVVGYKFGPDSLYNSVKHALVLKDLREEGYTVCDKNKQLDFLHCKKVVKVLAKFHAASIICRRDNPALFLEIDEEIFFKKSNKFDQEMKPWMQSGLKTVAEIGGRFERLESAVEFILNRVDSVADSIIEMYKPQELHLNVLNHGDLWCNNVLFKHNASEEVIDVKLIDFQVTRYTTPAMDLSYFFWTSANEDVREDKLLDLCEMYRQDLNSTLEQAGCEDRLTKEDLHQGFHEALDFSLHTICNTLPFIICDSEDGINLEEIPDDWKDGGIDFHKLYFGKSYQALFPKILIHYQTWLSHFA